MKRIAFVLTFGRGKKEITSIGGAERRLTSIFTSISSSELSVDLIYLYRANSDSVEKLLSKYFLGSNKPIYVKSNIEVFRRVYEGKYDYVCYTDCVLQTIPTILAAKLARSKRMMIIESQRRSIGIFHGKIEKFIMRCNYLSSTHLDTLYPASRQLLEQKYGKSKRPVTVTPCSLPRLEKYLSHAEKEKIVLFSGRLYGGKNPLLFLNAVIKCADSFRETGYVCYICGEGELRAKIENIIAESGCGDYIKSMGYQNMEEITPKCKVFCSLQTNDNYPSQALLEAITAGCYCICSDVGDTNVLIENTFGKLIPLSEESLITALFEMLDFSPSKWKEINASATQFAQEHFSINKATAHYTDLFLK